jgi:hypothetical protein
MPAMCDHEIRETKRGAGPCEITAEVKQRNGQPKWWCMTHGLAAGGPDGAPLERCPGAWFDPVPDELRREFDVTDGEIAVWGVVMPAISIGAIPPDYGKVHVHHRAHAGDDKDVDESFDIVTLRNGPNVVVVEGTAAVAYSLSELANRQVVPLACPRCREVHIDELKFAAHPHRKHLCNSCGRNFNDSSGPSISNPLADVALALGVSAAPHPRRAGRPLDIASADYSGIALWPSNTAILSTMTRPEEAGIHVHAWDDHKMLVIDETFEPVTIDGQEIDEALLRLLALQRSLAHRAPIIALDCAGCGEDLVSSTDAWLDPTTAHPCASCGTATKTRRRVFVNPILRACQPDGDPMGAAPRDGAQPGLSASADTAEALD